MRMEAFTGRLYNNMGLAHQQQQAHSPAVSYYELSLKAKRGVGDLLGIGRTAANICISYLERKNYARASYWRRKALSIIEKYELAFDRAFLLRRLGEIYCTQGREARGSDLLSEALRIYAGNPDLAFGVEITQREIAKCTKSHHAKLDARHRAH